MSGPQVCHAPIGHPCFSTQSLTVCEPNLHVATGEPTSFSSLSQYVAGFIDAAALSMLSHLPDDDERLASD
jgi:hypothetical protein